MRMILLVAPLLALGLGACQTSAPYGDDPYQPSGYPEPYPQPYPQPYPNPYPQPYPTFPPPYPTPYPGEPAAYRAAGNEPFWDLEIGSQMVFTDRGAGLTVREPTPVVRSAVNGRSYFGQRLRVDVTMSPCSDGMSDRTYPETVRATVDGRTYRGCGAPAGWWSQPGGNYSPPYGAPAVGLLAGSDWRVVRVNGRPAPPSGHYINFLADRLEAKFGCNTLGAGYRVQGEFVTAGALIATRMACPDMTLETIGSNVLSQPMRVDLADPRRLILSNAAGSIEAVRSN